MILSKSRTTVKRIALTAAFVALCYASWCAWIVIKYREYGPSRHPLDIVMPTLGSVDVFSLRFCPGDANSTHGVMCNSIGTKGPVKQISWDSHLMGLFGKPVMEASYHFDRDGRVDGHCTRGHIDFQGGSCSSHWDASLREWMYRHQGDSYREKNVVLDSNGRLVSSANDGVGGEIHCSYDGGPVLRTSTCSDREYINTYEYRADGRRKSYHRRRIPQASDEPERALELERAYALDIEYRYLDDSHGNWYSLILTQQPGDGPAFEVQVERTVEYYAD